MDAKELGNQRAFPTGDGVTPYQPGTTKRELFAAMVLSGMANSDSSPDTADLYARDAVTFADALLAELAKER